MARLEVGKGVKSQIARILVDYGKAAIQIVDGEVFTISSSQCIIVHLPSVYALHKIHKKEAVLWRGEN